MGTITDLPGLKREIAILENKRDMEKDAISQEVSQFVESLKPINLIKGLFTSVKNSPDLKADILHGAVGLGTGFLTNKLLLGSLHGPLKKVLATVVQGFMTKAAISYPETIKDTGISLLTKFLKSIRINTEGGIEKQHADGSSQL